MVCGVCEDVLLLGAKALGWGSGFGEGGGLERVEGRVWDSERRR